MLTEICAEIHNYFCKPENIRAGTFTIESGSIEPLSFLQTNQYYRIAGSVFNDGVHKYGDTHDTLTDETFEGCIWPMSVPPAVLALDAEIAAWIVANQSALNSPYASESFGGYSYSIRGGGVSTGATGAYSWKDQFAAKLKPYRKLREL